MAKGAWPEISSLAADLNGDAFPDLATANSYVPSVPVILNDAN
jgi:hypothetical protein